MKRWIIAVLILAAGVVLPCTAQATADSGKLGISLLTPMGMADYTVKTELSTYITDQFMLIPAGIGVTYRVVPALELRGVAFGSGGHTARYDALTNTDLPHYDYFLVGGSFSIFYDFVPASQLVVYVGPRVEGVLTNNIGTNSLVQFHQIGVYAILGVEYLFSPHFGVFGDIGLGYLFGGRHSKTDVPGTGTTSDTTSTFLELRLSRAYLGVTFFF